MHPQSSPSSLSVEGYSESMKNDSWSWDGRITLLMRTVPLVIGFHYKDLQFISLSKMNCTSSPIIGSRKYYMWSKYIWASRVVLMASPMCYQKCYFVSSFMELWCKIMTIPLKRAYSIIYNASIIYYLSNVQNCQTILW